MTGNPIPTETFDWLRDGSIVCREQLAVAVYPNDIGGVVIRSERGWDEDSDTFIIVQPECAQAVANAILRAAKLAAETVIDTPPPAADRPRAGTRNKPSPEPEQRPLAVNGGGLAAGPVR